MTETTKVCDTGNHLFVAENGKVFCSICGKTLRLSS